MDTDTPLYPLKFEPIYKEKVWGGRTLATHLGRSLPGDDQVRIGESWELADLSQSSLSGGGGGSERSMITNGSLAGLSLNEAIQKFGPRLMGRLRTTSSSDFPLLVKFLDARENLSVQVHPSPAYAQSQADAHPKSEAWYVVDAVPGAVIYKGVRPDVTTEQFRQAIENGSLPELLIKIPVKAGDCHYLPSGTCHAIGAGVLIAEVQMPSDTTFRVWDWGRTDRQLHVDQALACMTLGPPNVQLNEQRSHIAGMHTAVTRLVMCEHFRIEKVRMSEGYEQEIPYDQPAVWMVLEGSGRLVEAGKASTTGTESMSFAKGQTLLMPAGLNHMHVALDQDTVWLEVTFPQAMAEQIA